jgi:hypothetical protein
MLTRGKSELSCGRCMDFQSGLKSGEFSSKSEESENSDEKNTQKDKHCAAIVSRLRYIAEKRDLGAFSHRIT